ncbi:cell division protein [Halobacteriales archaeon QS_1_68_20]|nr:MAG: cell division protein [Halobacteriales archaeon QS_1_68_20]
MIGVGQAGGKLLDRFLAYDEQTSGSTARAALAVNTARTDLEGLEYIPRDRRVLIGQSRVKGHGVGGDNELGATIAQEDMTQIQRELDELPFHEIDAFLVIAALGGGTGSGGAPVLARQLNHLYGEPVYGLGVLPGTDEGSIYTLNAARSFRAFVQEADSLMLFDNDAWQKTGESLQGGYGEINGEIVDRFGVLFGAGELDGEAVAESVVDSSEIINTLRAGGVASVGYATTPVHQKRGLLDRFRRDGRNGDFDSTNAITSLVRQATRGRLTLPCDVQGSERALCVVAGPPDRLSRKGLSRARSWLEDETGSMEVRGGDYPMPGADHLAAVVLFAGVTEAPRLRQLQRAAQAAEQDIETRREQADEELEEILDAGSDLESLF